MRAIDQQLLQAERIWLFFFAFSTWLILMLFLWADAPRKMMKALSQQSSAETANAREIKVLLENPDDKKKEKEKKNLVYLSNKDTKARGKLTRQKGFEALTERQELAFAKRGKIKNKQIKRRSQTTENSISIKKADTFYVRIEKEEKTRETGFGGKTTWGKQKRTSIPTHYKFRRRFALSWDMKGEPRIPTKHYKHYQYFKDMIVKIREHWAPPGGQPFPTFGDSYHSITPTPGRMTYAAFPTQAIKVVFMLNEEGDVIDIKLWESLGYKSLDQSCIESIERSRNFGPPPTELVADGSMIVPFVFVIVTN